MRFVGSSCQLFREVISAGFVFLYFPYALFIDALFISGGSFSALVLASMISLYNFSNSVDQLGVYSLRAPP